ESVWTATAIHADIVFPANTFLERNDIVCGPNTYISPSRKVLKNYGQSCSDYDIFRGLSKRLDVLEEFTEGRDEMEWIKSIYQESQNNAKQEGVKLPSFREFWEGGRPINVESQMQTEENEMSKFRRNPYQFPLPTPSGKIEIF